MEEINKRVFSEVIEVLNNSEKEIQEKIPQRFINLLNENKDENYIPNINFSDEHWENSIEDDTRTILALIYRDYIVSDDERDKLIQEQNAEEKRIEEEIREKYNPDNVFKKRVNDNRNKQENLLNNKQLIEVKEASWFKRLYKKILSIFGIHK